MKRLTLLRHAKSGVAAQRAPDFERALNDQGAAAARAVGRMLRSEGARYDAVLASDATRVVQTLAQVEEGYGRPLGTQWDRRLYLASAVTLLDAVHALPDAAETALVAGHNSGLEDLVLLLAPPRADDMLRVAVEEKFPTASLAVLECEGGWRDFGKGTARLTRFVRPRDLDPALASEAD